MPVHTIDTVRRREESLAKRLREKGAGLDAERKRALKKKLRRAARKRRRLASAEVRRTTKANAPA